MMNDGCYGIVCGSQTAGMDVLNCVVGEGSVARDGVGKRTGDVGTQLLLGALVC